MTQSKETAAPVLIVGATSDISIALAHLFAGDGHPLILAARDPTRLEIDKADLSTRYGVEVYLTALDILDTEHHSAFVAALDPMPHICVCMVGLLGDQAEQERDPKAARAVIDSNMIGPAVLMEALASRLTQIDAPTAIVGVSSIAGDRGRARNYYYGAAKAGFTAILSGLRQRLARTKTTVITVKPGFVATRMTEGMDLIPALTDSPQKSAQMIKRAIRHKRLVVYPWKWRLVMWIVRAIPEPVFKFLKF